MQRDNQAWLVDLRSEGERQDTALNDLRDILLRVLPNALSQWLSSDSGHFDAFLGDVAPETVFRVLDHLETFEGQGCNPSDAPCAKAFGFVSRLRGRTRCFDASSGF